MGLWDRLRGVGPGGYHDRAARRLERDGDLSGAVEAYLEGGLGDEAARVLMLRGDAESSLERRMAFFEKAAEAAQSKELARKAKARKARLFYDLVKQKGNATTSELIHAANELEAAGEFLAAAEAFATVGDAEGEIRALTGAGAIDRLEDRLQRDAAVTRLDQERTLALRRMQDLDRAAERRAALKVAAEMGDREERLVDLAREIRQRLVRGPLCTLTVDGRGCTLALGDEVTLGRGDATIVLGSRALSRIHLVLRRNAEGEPFVEDAGTRNGTFLHGAKLAGPIPVGGGIELKLGGEIACALAPLDEGIGIKVGGATYLAPLGAFRAGPFRLTLEGKGGDDASFVVLESEMERPAYRGQLALARRVELCFGDAIASERGGEAALIVGQTSPS
ncbi:MAG: FHA domain-containing protein [Polyangiaceae bacterium]|nr:FHA domain-containing protein [Polyangiaceae bacterium]